MEIGGGLEVPGMLNLKVLGQQQSLLFKYKAGETMKAPL